MVQIAAMQRAAVAPVAKLNSTVTRALPRAPFTQSLKSLNRPASEIVVSIPCLSRVRGLHGRQVVARAKEASFEFDQFLIDLQEKFERSENKTSVIGYTAAAAGAFTFAEWLIHLPLFNFLLGFPIQLLGLLLVPYLAIRYTVDGEDWFADASDATDRVIKELPGIGKK